MGTGALPYIPVGWQVYVVGVGRPLPKEEI